jgi:phosphatidate cytidylyltransferase
MQIMSDIQALSLIGGIFGFLTIATLISLILKKWASGEKMKATLNNVMQRITAWWIIFGLYLVALLNGKIGLLILFGIISFLALREFITITPTNSGDHKALWVIFFLILPAQYYLIGIAWYGLFTILIPVYAFVLLPMLTTLAGEFQHYFERTAKIQWGVMICVYCVSHAPALLIINIPNYHGQTGKLLLFLILVVELSDVFQFLWGKCCGKHKILPNVSPNKTWEGFLGGTLTASLIGMGCWWATPFHPIQALLLSMMITLLGFGGDLTLSAIKRDLGIKDYSSIIPGHGGIMDRIDSLCFAAPIFFHVTRFFWGAN